uniref:DUF7336 domain-containing protein n=1 Tax=Chitiniphilus eburneus TaxID=2571148 RepID=UPI004055F5D6
MKLWGQRVISGEKIPVNVYVLEHIYGNDECESENYKFLGVFDSAESAEKAIEFLSGLPGFRDYPDGFLIEKYAMNDVHWTEGFGWGE